MGEDRITVEELVKILGRYDPKSEVCFRNESAHPGVERAREFVEVTERRLSGDPRPWLVIIGVR